MPFFGAAKEKALFMAEAAINSSTGESPFPKTWSGPELDALEARIKGLNEAYQGIGGKLKPAMRARAKSSIAKLEVDPNYLNSIEYAGLEAALKSRLEEREKVLGAKLKLELDQAERIREGEEISIERQFRVCLIFA